MATLKLTGAVAIFLTSSLLLISTIQDVKKKPQEAAPLQEPAQKKPIELPPLGERLDAKNGDVWELRNGELVQIAGDPTADKIIGVGQSKPIEIPGYTGSSMTRLYFWRSDGVSPNGDKGEDLVKPRPDVIGDRIFDKNGDIIGHRSDGAGEGAAEELPPGVETSDYP